MSAFFSLSVLHFAPLDLITLKTKAYKLGARFAHGTIDAGVPI